MLAIITGMGRIVEGLILSPSKNDYLEILLPLKR